MDHLNVFISQIAVIFLPGIIWARIDARYSVKEKPTEFDFFLRALVYGVSSYVVTFIIYNLFGYKFFTIDVTVAEKRNILNQQISIEIIIATVVGFVLSIVWVYAATKKWLTRFLQFLGATKRYGDEDVWDFTFNSTDQAVRFVNVRDFEKQIVYTGWVNAFSETDKLRELTLYEVQIYDWEAKLVYEVPRIYLARKPDDIHIEFPLEGQARK